LLQPSRDIVGRQNLKNGPHDPNHALIKSDFNCHPYAMTDVAYLYRRFSNSSFSHSRDMATKI